MMKFDTTNPNEEYSIGRRIVAMQRRAALSCVTTTTTIIIIQCLSAICLKQSYGFSFVIPPQQRTFGSTLLFSNHKSLTCSSSSSWSRLAAAAEANADGETSTTATSVSDNKPETAKEDVEVSSKMTALTAEAEEDDDEDEWEYEEYTMLTEEDFYGSEWKTGTVWNNKQNKVEETWVRLVTKDSKLVAYWGDGAEGKWSFDTASQFFSVSKESFGGWNGKKIWAGTVDDYYYMSGTVRGWSVLLPASVLGQWQFKRLGCTDEERGIAPWFETQQEQENDEEESATVEETN